MSKYDPLVEYLKAQRKKTVRLTFQQIESILGSELPASALKHPRWWGGNSAVWLFAGWRAIPHLRKKRVDFRRDKTAQRLLAQRLTPPRQTSKESRRTRKQKKRASKTGTWGGTHFEFVCRVEPVRKGKRIVEYQPHVRYVNAEALPLHQWGEGPFCRFQIPASSPIPGVYVITVAGEAKYVGETENLTARYNNGYGTISPRSCFTGGQSTNCRINSFVLRETLRGRSIELWFTPSDDRTKLEASLIGDLQPRWNRK